MRGASAAERAAAAANALVTAEGSRDPRALCRALGVALYERPDFHELKGMYALIEGRPCIFVKADLEDSLKKLVLAHELGHDRLHRDLMGKLAVLQDLSVWDASGRPEKEANLFAAELLIEDEVFLRLAREGYSLPQLARELAWPEELLRLKAEILRGRGVELRLNEPVKAAFLASC